MFEFTLFKSLFFEMDPFKMDGVIESKEKQITSRRLEVAYDAVPQVTSITSQERILPYLDRYYFYINDEALPAELDRVEVKQVIYEFFKEKFPEYLKEDLPSDMTDVNILEAFNVFKMPDYRPKHAFPGIVTLEDLRNGNVKQDTRQFAFPGLELFSQESKDLLAQQGKPAYISDKEDYTAFDKEDTDKARAEVNDKLAEMKKLFANDLKAVGYEEKPEE